MTSLLCLAKIPRHHPWIACPLLLMGQGDPHKASEWNKFFVWDELVSSVIKMTWQCKVAEQYKALMCSLRKGKKRPCMCLNRLTLHGKYGVRHEIPLNLKLGVRKLPQIDSLRLQDLDLVYHDT
ncbi:hypothetical protein DsansV1_C28g0205321 [Dioscorea sansibarensis]